MSTSCANFACGEGIGRPGIEAMMVAHIIRV